MKKKEKMMKEEKLQNKNLAGKQNSKFKGCICNPLTYCVYQIRFVCTAGMLFTTHSFKCLYLFNLVNSAAVIRLPPLGAFNSRHIHFYWKFLKLYKPLLPLFISIPILNLVIVP